MAAPVSPLPRVFALALLATLGACSDIPKNPQADRPRGDDVSGDDISGQKVYEQPLADGNSFACATCHALSEPSDDGLRRPGHPIGDAIHRTQWKNGRAPTFLDAVNSCVTEWMIAPAWTPSEPRYLALRSFLEAQATTATATDLSYEIVAPPRVVGGGDARRGRDTFNESCVVCHGTDGLGTIRGPRVAGSQRLPDYIAGRIRLSGSSTSPVYDGLTGGVMPFWAQDRLSDDEVRDLVAFITDQSVPSSPGTGGSGPVVDEPPAPGGACGKTHPHVGWTADLGVNTGEGQVSGFVTAIDDCTLELHDFSYDGNGIDVRVYGSKSSSFRPAFTMGPNLVGRTFRKQTLRVSLPPEYTLDDLAWVGIWCVAVGADFGSGPFESP